MGLTVSRTWLGALIALLAAGCSDGGWRAEPVPFDLDARPGSLARFQALEAESGDRIAGRVSHVRDGDTIEVEGVGVRIANLDCPERDTEAGQRARVLMTRLIRGRAVACELEGRRSWDREVGTCALAASGVDLGEVLIAEGTCGRWRSSRS